MRAALLAFLVLTGCEGTDTTSSFATSDTADGHEIQSVWTYRSFKVDVDLTLTTLEGEPSACSTTAKLVVNDVVSSTRRYALPATDCSVLRLTDSGDIVFYGQATGHDWTLERLEVDTGDESISLGPVSSTAPGADESMTFRFTLAAPPCPDDDDCDCGALRRFSEDGELALELGRICE